MRIEVARLVTNRKLAISLATLAFVAMRPIFAAGPASSGPDAQAYVRHGLDPKSPLESRMAHAAASVLGLFREAGRPDPKRHVLTVKERTQFNAVIRSLPPLHRRVLTGRLRSMSFLDGMPNTALTSTVNPNEPFRLFDITFNARILGENVSEWLTRKEATVFDTAGSPVRVSFDAGNKVDALLYVLVHEATHIVDMAEGITPPLSASGQSAKPRVSGQPRLPREFGAT
jgi:hypothetical protein